MKKIVTYTTILHGKRKELGLNSNEYICADIIDRLSNPWCTMNKYDIADRIGVTTRTLARLEASLIEKGLLYREEKGKIQATQEWRDAVNTEEVTDKMSHGKGKTVAETAVPTDKMSHLYNKKTTTKNKIKDFLPEESKQSVISKQKERTDPVKKTETPVKKQTSDVAKKTPPVKPTKVAHDPLTQLPLWSAKSPLTRLVSVYGAKYHDRYQTAYHAQFWAKYGMLYKPLLANFTEYQISALILLHFDWKGATGTDDFTHKRLVDANFPLEWVPRNVNAYKTYIINVLGVDFDKPAEIKKYVVDQLRQLKEFKRKD